MAEALFLVTKSAQTTSMANTLVDGIYGVIINKDDAQTSAQIIADAVAQCRVGGHPLRDNYFDTTQNLELVAGPLKDNKDMFAILRRGIQTVEG